MRGIKMIIWAIIIFVLVASGASYSQQMYDIDNVDSYYWSGYGKVDMNGDTLYANCLDGHGVERYDIADPANPVFIDRQNVTGFDIIDFENRLMYKFISNMIKILGFSNFTSPELQSSLEFSSEIQQIEKRNCNLFVDLANDSLYVYDISDPVNPFILSSNHIPHKIIIGTTVLLNSYQSNGCIYNLYDITNPIQISYVATDTLGDDYEWYWLDKGVGDTIAANMSTVMFTRRLYFYQFYTDGSREQLHSHYHSGELIYQGGHNCYSIYIGTNEHAIYSFDNFEYRGYIDNIYYFGGIFYLSGNNNLIVSSQSSIDIYDIIDPPDSMPLLSTIESEHYYVLSSYTYSDGSDDYLLTGIGSDGGKLLIHQIDDSDGALSPPVVLENLSFLEMTSYGLNIIGLCSDRIVNLDMSTPASPQIIDDISGFAGQLLDMEIQDNLLFVITDRDYSIIEIDTSGYFNTLSSLYFPAHNLTSLAHEYPYSFLLLGDIGTVYQVRMSSLENPYVQRFRQLSQPVYQSISNNNGQIWASGAYGTDIIHYANLDSLGFFGIVYFSDAYQIYFGEDTLYVADGVNGLKVFTHDYNPLNGISLVGHYITNTPTSHVARYNDNFYIADFYSLRHLRWGQPTSIFENDFSTIPHDYFTSTNYPNPFNSSTTISYTLPQAADVRLDIYDILGRKVQALYDGKQTAGKHSIIWNADGFSSGVYFYKVTTGDYTKTKKMMLLK